MGQRLVPQVQAMAAAAQKLREDVPGATVRFSAVTAAPEVVSGTNRPLSPPMGGSGIDVVRQYLSARQGLYGLASADIATLHDLGESVSPSGVRMVRVEQRVNGLPIFQSESRFILDASGQVWRSLGLLVPSGASVPPPGNPPAVSAEAALAAAMSSVGVALDITKMSSAPAAQGKVEVTVDDPVIVGAVPSELVYFPVGPRQLVAAWSQVIFTNGDSDWYTVVDASSGALLWRKNIRDELSTEEARFSVYVQPDGITPADSPAPASPNVAVPGAGTQFPEIARTIVAMSAAQDIGASPDGWIPDGSDTTTGNNVDAYLDAVGGGEANVPDIGALDNNGRPVGNPDSNTNDRDFLGAAPRDFDYAPAPVGGDPDAGDVPTGVDFRRGAVTQLFYTTNWYHDQLFNLGFDEAAGNFQATNYSGQGAGGDHVLAEAQDNSGTNNANFSTPPDGTSGRMQMFRFTGPNPDRDGTIDNEIVLHELTHGLSNRLIGNATGLVWSVGRGMGEGWSDFYALSLLNATNADDPDARYATGGYATYQLGGQTDNYVYGIRRFPYSTDNSVNPLTWADVDDVTADYSGGIPVSPLGFENNGALSVHNIGEVWALSLWEVRSRIIADPAGANGDVPTGNLTMLQIVTDALKLTPSNPSFIDARDALILADCIANACANEQWIWDGFADRGLGYGAVAPLGQMGFSGFGHMGVGESFDLPFLDAASTTVDDSLGNGSGGVDPGEPFELTVELANPWSGAAFDVPDATATLSTTAPGVTILDDTATYGAIPAGGSASGDAFLVRMPEAALCGESVTFTVETTSALGTTSFDVSLRVGVASGTGTPVVYTRSPGLAIPDNNRRGVVDTLTITDDLEIADLDFRLDSLTHTFTGDVTAMLRGPNGYGGDLVWLRELLFSGGDGDNFINTVIDDESANDLNQTTSGQAPYTGSWAPAFNSPVWALFGDASIFADPVGQLSRFDGMSTQGDWSVLVADSFAADTGTLNSWSIIVTPTAFSCTAFTGGALVTGTKSVSGTFVEGGAITYTIVLMNNGTSGQLDNPGDEFVDVLPAGTTLVSASATSGTAVATIGTNTVTWNGAIAAGDSVTITIQATIDAGTAGQSLVNVGTINFDSDVDGDNDQSVATEDPDGGGPTEIVIEDGGAVGIPTVSPLGLLALMLMLSGVGYAILRRRAR